MALFLSNILVTEEMTSPSLSITRLPLALKRSKFAFLSVVIVKFDRLYEFAVIALG